MIISVTKLVSIKELVKEMMFRGKMCFIVIMMPVKQFGINKLTAIDHVILLVIVH
jgi:hypothetical protein